MRIRNYLAACMLCLVPPLQNMWGNDSATKSEVRALYPLGERGLFEPGETIIVRARGKSPAVTDEEATWNWVVRNYLDEVVQRGSLKAKMVAGEFMQDLPLQAISDQKGFFTIDVTLASGEKKFGGLSSSFCILSKSTPRDRFLFSNGNGSDKDLVPAMKWMGIHGKSLPFQIHSVPLELRGKWTEFIEQEKKEGRHAPFLNSNVALAGQFTIQHMPVWLKEEVAQKKAKHEQPYSEEYYKEYGDFVEASAEAYKGVIRDWIVSEEIDITCAEVGDATLAGFELERYIRTTKIVYERVKKVIPDARVIALTLSSDAELTHTPKLRWTRRNLIPRLKGAFDLIGPDVYAGPWLITRHNAENSGPERWKFRQILLDLVDFQREMDTGEEEIIIGEKGLMIPYHAPPNDELEKLMADQTARNIILARSVKAVVMYQHYLVGSGAGYRADVLKLTETKGHPLGDEAAWKSGYYEGVPYYRPRSVVAAIHTVESLLSGIRGATELAMPEGVYAYLFERADGEQVAALWTPGTMPIEMNVKLPEHAKVIDLMGNRKKTDFPEALVTLSRSPLFIQLEGDHQTARELLESASFPSHELLEADITMAGVHGVVVHLRNRSARSLEVVVGLHSETVGEWKQSRKAVKIPPLSGESVLFEWETPLASDNQLSRQISGRANVDGREIMFTKGLEGIPVSRKSEKPTFVLRGGGSLFPSTDVAISGAWRGNDDLSGEVTLTWDDTHLHIRAVVKDDIHLQRYADKNIWKDDSIQFGISAASSSPLTNSAEGFGKGDSVFGLALYKGEPVLHRWVDNGEWLSDRNARPDFPHRVSREGKKTLYEVSIPWSALPQCKPEVGQALAFNLVIFDKDDAALEVCDYWMAFSTGLAGGADSSNYKRFILSP